MALQLGDLKARQPACQPAAYSQQPAASAAALLPAASNQQPTSSQPAAYSQQPAASATAASSTWDPLTIEGHCNWETLKPDMQPAKLQHTASNQQPVPLLPAALWIH